MQRNRPLALAGRTSAAGRDPPLVQLLYTGRWRDILIEINYSITRSARTSMDWGMVPSGGRAIRYAPQIEVGPAQCAEVQGASGYGRAPVLCSSLRRRHKRWSFFLASSELLAAYIAPAMDRYAPRSSMRMLNLSPAANTTSSNLHALSRARKS